MIKYNIPLLPVHNDSEKFVICYPLRRLFTALMNRSISDLYDRNAVTRGESILWFQNYYSSEIGFSYPTVCDHLDLKPDKLFERLQNNGLIPAQVVYLQRPIIHLTDNQRIAKSLAKTFGPASLEICKMFKTRFQ